MFFYKFLLCISHIRYVSESTLGFHVTIHRLYLLWIWGHRGRYLSVFRYYSYTTEWKFIWTYTEPIVNIVFDLLLQSLFEVFLILTLANIVIIFSWHWHRGTHILSRNLSIWYFACLLHISDIDQNKSGSQKGHTCTIK